MTVIAICFAVSTLITLLKTALNPRKDAEASSACPFLLDY